MIRSILTAGAFACFALASTSPAQAALLAGNTVKVSYLYPDAGTLADGPHLNVVGQSDPTLLSPFDLPNLLRASFSDMRIVIDSPTADRSPGSSVTFFNGAFFNGLLFSDANKTIDRFWSVNISNLTTVTGFDMEHILFNDDDIDVNLSGVRFGYGQRIVLDLNRTDTMDAVPEPATWAMMLVGFGLVGAAARRRRVAVRYA